MSYFRNPYRELSDLRFMRYGNRFEKGGALTKDSHLPPVAFKDWFRALHSAWRRTNLPFRDMILKAKEAGAKRGVLAADSERNDSQARIERAEETMVSKFLNDPNVNIYGRTAKPKTIDELKDYFDEYYNNNPDYEDSRREREDEAIEYNRDLYWRRNMEDTLKRSRERTKRMYEQDLPWLLERSKQNYIDKYGYITGLPDVGTQELN